MFATYANKKVKRVANRELDSYRLNDRESVEFLHCGIEQHSEYVNNTVGKVKRITGCKMQDQNFVINF